MFLYIDISLYYIFLLACPKIVICSCWCYLRAHNFNSCCSIAWVGTTGSSYGCNGLFFGVVLSINLFTSLLISWIGHCFHLSFTLSCFFDRVFFSPLVASVHWTHISGHGLGISWLALSYMVASSDLVSLDLLSATWLHLRPFFLQDHCLFQASVSPHSSERVTCMISISNQWIWHNVFPEVLSFASTRQGRLLHFNGCWDVVAM